MGVRGDENMEGGGMQKCTEEGGGDRGRGEGRGQLFVSVFLFFFIKQNFPSMNM